MVVVPSLQLLRHLTDSVDLVPAANPGDVVRRQMTEAPGAVHRLPARADPAQGIQAFQEPAMILH